MWPPVWEQALPVFFGRIPPLCNIFDHVFGCVSSKRQVLCRVQYTEGRHVGTSVPDSEITTAGNSSLALCTVSRKTAQLIGMSGVINELSVIQRYRKGIVSCVDFWIIPISPLNTPSPVSALPSSPVLFQDRP